MLIRIGTTNMNKIVLVVTTFVEYPISPLVSLTKIGNAANTGAADCITNVFISKSFNCTKCPAIFNSTIMTIEENTNLPSKAKFVSKSNRIL